MIITVCCVITSLAYFGTGAWDLLKGHDRSAYWDGWSCLVRGLVWAVLAVSLNIHRTTGERVLVVLWWATFSVLLSAVNVELLVKNHSIPVLDLALWPMNLLLLFRAIQLIRDLISSDTQYESLSEPLLAEEGENRTRYQKIGFVSHVAFSWINPLLRLGYSKKLEINDIPSLESADEARLAYQMFTGEWDAHRKKRKTTSNLVLRALANCYMKEMIVVGFLAFLRTVSVVVAPVFLFVFLKYSNSEEQNLKAGLLLVAWLVVIKVVESLSQRHWFFGARKYGLRMRSALMVAVFQKLLKLSSLGRRVHSTGEIVNYIAVDAYRLGEFPWWFHYAWTLPLQLIFSIAILFFTVGYGALPGLVPLIGCALLNVPYARMLQRCQSQFMRGQDERLRATSEVLNSIKIIKLQSWEEKFRNLIETLRDIEFKWLKELQIKKTYGTVLYWMSPIFISSVVFAGCALLKSAPLNAATFFTVLATLRVMSEPVRMLPEALSALIQVKVSLDRLDVFLLDNELKEEDVKRSPSESSDFSVRIHEGVFGWNADGAPPTLRGLNMDIIKGQKIAVCGPVGAGKSSLLNAVLGEIPKINGRVEVYGTIAYVSQTAWIQSGTIRDNILYGKPMIEKNYEKAIKVCALGKDIDNFDHGDLTEIGQRGLNLSGGQKQRLQLARAVYNDADIYLLDDPFSAVDAHTSATLFNECVMSALQNKTVILVTHQVEFLAEVDRILVMEAGQVTQSGNYNELMNSGAAFERLVTAHQDAMNVFENVSSETRGKTQNKIGEHIEISGPTRTKENSQNEITVKGLSVQLTEDEEVEAGDVGWRPYIDYFRVSNGFFLLASMVVGHFIFVIFQAASTYWLAIAVQIPHISAGVLVGVYAAISTASSDMSVVDFDIPFSLAFAVTASIEVISTILIMATVTWQVLIVAVPVIFIARYVQGYYQASARELIRINGTTKAPVMNYAAETALGAVTIRAFDMVQRFFENNLKLVDANATLFFHTNAAMEWVLVRVEALQNLTIFTATLLLVLLPKGTISPGEQRQRQSRLIASLVVDNELDNERTRRKNGRSERADSAEGDGGIEYRRRQGDDTASLSLPAYDDGAALQPTCDDGVALQQCNLPTMMALPTTKGKEGM
ncbi:hypothetical protein ACLOJK_040061 [Asimina triloba]